MSKRSAVNSSGYGCPGPPPPPHRESTLEWPSTVQSRLCGWSLRVSTWFIFQSGISLIAPVANLAVQSFSSMWCTQPMPVSGVNHFHPPGPLHIFLHDTDPPLLSAKKLFNAMRQCYFEMKPNKEPCFSILSIILLWRGCLVFFGRIFFCTNILCLI